MTHEEKQYNKPTVQDKEIFEEMNVTNMEQNSETSDGEGNSQSAKDVAGNSTTHGYNLWPRPTRQQERLNLMQTGQQSTYTEYMKPHLHIMMMQMSVKAGIKKLGKNEMMPW